MPGMLRALELAVVLFVNLLGGCQGQPPPQAGSVQLKGSETLRPLLTICAEDFMTRHPHIDVMVQGGGSGTGIAALLQGTVDIAMASRELSDKEQQYAARQGLAVRAFDFPHRPRYGRAPPVAGARVGNRPHSDILAVPHRGHRLVSVLLGTGTLIWLLERQQNPQHFHPHYVRGIADGLWWSAVTMTTVGYGDKTPVTWAGRLVSLLWMFTSVFLMAFFAAVLASSFTAVHLHQPVNGPEDLAWAGVAMVAGTSGEAFLRHQGLPGRSYPFVIQACKALQRGDVEAVVSSKAILGHMLKEYGWKDVSVLPHTLVVEDYALLLPSGSPLRVAINRAVLHTVYSAAWKATVQRYMAAGE